MRRSYCPDSSDINTDMPLKTDELELLSVFEKRLEFLYILKVILTKFMPSVLRRQSPLFFPMITCGQSSLISKVLPSPSKRRLVGGMLNG